VDERDNFLPVYAVVKQVICRVCGEAVDVLPRPFMRTNGSVNFSLTDFDEIMRDVDRVRHETDLLDALVQPYQTIIETECPHRDGLVSDASHDRVVLGNVGK